MNMPPQARAWAGGESACRPGSVTPRFLTCRDSPGTRSGLAIHFSARLTVFPWPLGVRRNRDGTGTVVRSVSDHEVTAAHAGADQALIAQDGERPLGRALCYPVLLSERLY